MKALISPNENNRICDIEAVEFEVAPPLFWVDVPEGVDQYWTYVDGQFIAPVAPEVIAPPEPTKAELMAELAALTAKIQALGA
jgi:hypothetical protein